MRAALMDQGSDFLHKKIEENPDLEIEVVYADIIFGMCTELAFTRISRDMEEREKLKEASKS